MSAEDVNASSLSSDDTITTETMACHCTQKSHRAKSTTNACGPSFFYDGNHTTLRASSVVKSSSPAPPKDQESPELSTKTADIFTGVFYKPIKDDCMPFEKCPPFKEVAARKDSLELQDDKIDEETLTPASVRFVVSPLISDQDIPTLRTRFSIALAKAAPSFPAARVILNTSKISIDIDTCIRRDFFDVFCDSQAHANHLGRLEQMTEAGEGFSTALYTMLCVGVGKPMYPRSIGVELLPVARPGKCLPSTVIADEDYMKALKKVIDSMHWKGSIPAGASHDESIIGLWRETSWLTRNGKTEHQPLLSVRAALKIPPPPFVTSRICAWVLNTHPDYVSGDKHSRFVSRSNVLIV